MYGEVYWWEVSMDRNHNHKVRISNIAGWWTLQSYDCNIFKFDKKEIAEECGQLLMKGWSINSCLNQLYKYDIWVDPRDIKCYLRDKDGKVNR